MVLLYNNQDMQIREFPTATAFDRQSVTFDNNGYPGKIYANTDAGEYFDDPDNPLPPEPEIPPDPAEAAVDEILGIIVREGGLL